ncbi:hypothetical protein [Myceligenerans crystallogenes]|uniref:SWIM-type domain-containing protein n=1 Tax=Myceligenerans crystallogenes TaxID=316335 RepID=A0ABN2NGT0_9MICO
MTYLEAYAGLGDEALAELASTGLLRRARKLSDDVAVAGSDAKGADLVIGGHAVRVDARGPAAVACACPTGGVCVHVVVACGWARDEAARNGVEPPTPQAPADPAASGSGPGETAAGGPGGAAGPAKRAAAGKAGRPDGSAGKVAGPAGSAGKAAGAAGRAGTGRRATPASSAKQAAAVKRQEVALAEVRDAVVHLLDGGLAHLRDDTAESLRALAGRVRVAAFEPVHGLRLDALLRTAAGQSGDLAAHDDTTGEADLLETLAEIWALCETHDALATGRGSGSAAATTAASMTTAGTTAAAPTGQEPGGPGPVGNTAAEAPATARPQRKNRSGRDEDETDLGRVVPLAVRWWTSPSGARGIAFAGWDPEAGRVRTAVTGRPAGGDPGFRREWELPLLWSASPARLSSGPFALTGVRERTDGTLGAGGSPRLSPLGAFDVDELRDIAERTGTATPARDVVGFGRRPARVRLLLVRDTGDVGVDEVRQDLTWTVTDSTGQPHLLRVPIEDRRTADTLLHVVAGKWNVVAVTAERHDDRLEPAGIFLRAKDGEILLVSPSITEQHQLGRDSRWTLHHWETWRKRLSRVAGMRSRARAVTEVAEPDQPVVRACALAWDVTVALAATGRRRLTPRQLSDVVQARALARDLGLTTLERALGDLDPDAGISPQALARTAFLVRRTREIASAS